MTKYYRRVEVVDGETAEPVNFVGIHPAEWPGYIAPTVAFVESDKADEMEKLLLLIRDILAHDPEIWMTELISWIDALLGDKANRDKDS